VFVMEYHLKTSVIDVLSDQTHNSTSEFVDVLLVTLYMDLNVYLT
jgi:hypothetical protein